MTRLVSQLNFLLAVILALTVLGLQLHAQTAQRPTTQGQKPAAPQRPAAPTTKPPATTAKPPAPATAKPAEPAPPPKPVAQDLRTKTAYTTAGQKTESVTYKKGPRERFEFGDVILINQHDLKRTLQIMTAANSYMVVPEGATPATPAAAPGGAPAPTPGVVSVTTTITDTGERKMMFGLQARHATTVIDKQPAAGACDPSKQHIETDGWYVDLPAGVMATQDVVAPPASGVCLDQINATVNGDPKVLGFPVGYATTIVGEDGKPTVVSMEISELELTNLDASLFEPAAGMTEVGNLQALTKAVSDANETKLAASLTAASPPVTKTPGVPLVGVPEIANKTTQQVDTRALRDKLVAELASLSLTATPLASGQTDLAQQAGAHGYDYVLVGEITDLKATKSGGGVGGLIKSASKVVAGAGTSNAEPAEAAISFKLVQPDGKNRYTTNAKGKTGGGGAFDIKSMAKTFGTGYFNLMSGRFLMNALNQKMMSNLGGMGMLNDPSLLNMQTRGLGSTGGLRPGLGIDPTAGAASFLMQQSMASGALTSGAMGPQAASFEEALGDALKNGAKSVADNLKKK